MAWVKIPAEHHPLFLAALPKDPRVSTIQMFGGIAAKANGYLFGGLFARSAIVRLSAEDQRTALALDGAAPFDPMGNGRVMMDTIALPEAVMDEPEQLRDWLARALTFTVTLPPKAKAATKPRSSATSRPKAGKPSAAVPAKPARAKQPAAKPARAKQPAAKPAPRSKPGPAAKPSKPAKPRSR